MNRNITAKMNREWFACYSDDRLAALYGEGELDIAEVMTRRDGEWADVSELDRRWVFSQWSAQQAPHLLREWLARVLDGIEGEHPKTVTALLRDPAATREQFQLARYQADREADAAWHEGEKTARSGERPAAYSARALSYASRAASYAALAAAEAKTFDTRSAGKSALCAVRLALCATEDAARAASYAAVSCEEHVVSYSAGASRSSAEEASYVAACAIVCPPQTDRGVAKDDQAGEK